MLMCHIYNTPLQIIFRGMTTILTLLNYIIIPCNIILFTNTTTACIELPIKCSLESIIVVTTRLLKYLIIEFYNFISVLLYKTMQNMHIGNNY